MGGGGDWIEGFCKGDEGIRVREGENWRVEKVSLERAGGREQ